MPYRMEVDGITVWADTVTEAVAFVNARTGIKPSEAVRQEEKVPEIGKPNQDGHNEVAPLANANPPVTGDEGETITDDDLFYISPQERRLRSRTLSVLEFLASKSPIPVPSEVLRKHLGDTSSKALSGMMASTKRILADYNISLSDAMTSEDRRGVRVWRCGPRVQDAIAALAGPPPEPTSVE